MNINISEFIKLRDLASLAFRRKHTIVLNPEEQQEKKDTVNEDIEYDKVDWKIPNKDVGLFIDKLSKNSQLSNEEKILLVYQKLCQTYIYDDNVLSYIRKYDDDSFGLPDWYGRDTDEEWEENRELHNRRVCYEVSRYLAKSLKELFKDNEEFNICIFWDKGLTHYFVGVSCNDYSLTLDLDDFNNIKDLTRVKAGLTTQGIIVLEDNQDKFKNALDTFNEGKNKEAIKSIESEIANNTINSNSNIIEDVNFNQTKENEDIVFLKNALAILSEKYDIDSQGIFEYMKEIVDIKLGPESRKKIWKELKTSDNKLTTYTRCLVLDVNNQKYIIDVDQKILRSFDENELKNEDSDFIPYKDLVRNWRSDRYNGL